LRGGGKGESGTGFLIVLDNYQEIPDDSQFHEMLVQGLDVIPAGINVVIVSRREPPARFARLRANNGMSIMGWNDLRFTPEETAEVISTGIRKELTPSPRL
jgi:ATP/maltotriose-dependent transcriptional regulator MalT